MSRYGYIKHSELSHHGILGMKWGKRNGPPYPLQPGDHSAQEKRLNNGTYSQGVKQDRSKKGSGKSSGGNGKRELTEEEKAARRKKIKTALAVGAGVTAAAALTAGGIYAAKHPETMKALAGNIKDKVLTARQLAKVKKGIRNDSSMSKETRKKVLNALKNHSILKEGAKERAKENLKNAKLRDKADRNTRIINKQINKQIKSAARTAKRNERKGILDTITGNEEKIIQNPRLLAVNRDKIVKERGTEGLKDLTNKAKVYEANVNYANSKNSEYKSNKGIRGVAKKVWKPIAGTAGVVGTVSGTLGKIKGGLNTARSVVNDPLVKKYLQDDYDDDYYYDNNGQPKKKKKGN